MAGARSQARNDSDYVEAAETLGYVVMGKIQEHVHEEPDRRRIKNLLKQLKKSAKAGNSHYVLMHAYNLGSQIAHVVMRNHYGSTGHTRLATIGRKAVARGIARKYTVMSETDAFAELAVPEVHRIATENPTRGREDIVGEVIKRMQIPRSARCIFDLIKGRIPPGSRK